MAKIKLTKNELKTQRDELKRFERYLPTLEATADHVARHVVEGDLVVTMGAGDVWKVADEPTQKFMVSFYKHLYALGNKKKAFLAAQKELREEILSSRFLDSQ